MGEVVEDQAKLKPHAKEGWKEFSVEQIILIVQGRQGCLRLNERVHFLRAVDFDMRNKLKRAGQVEILQRWFI